MARKRQPFMRETRRADGVKTFTTQVRVHGHSASGTFNSKDAALEWHAAKRAEFESLAKRGHATRSDISKLTLANLIDSYLKDPKTAAQKSRYDTMARLAWWINEHGAVKLLDFGLLQVRAAAAKLAKGRKGSTANRYLSTARSCWHWGQAAGFVPEDRSWPRRVMLPEPRGRQRYLSADELTALLKASKDDPMLECAITVSVTTGLRIGEMLRLMWADVDLARARLIVHESKTGQSRTVRLPPPTVAALKKWRGKLIGADCVFPGPGGKLPIIYAKYSRRYRAIRTAADLCDVRIHDLRHSTASFLASRGASLPTIGGVLGHKSAQTTARYTHLVQGEPLKEDIVFTELLK